MFGALRHANFRRFLCAHFSATTGHWIQQVTLAWLVYRLSDSALFLGLSGALTLLPSLILTPFVGVWSDRLDRRKLLLATQAASLVHASALLLLVGTGYNHLGVFLGSALFQGIIQGFDWTNRQSLMAQLVDDRQDLPNAIALNSMVFNLCRILGPSLAGLLMVQGGEVYCFLVTALGEGVALLFTARLRLGAPPATTSRPPFLDDFQAGIRFARASLPIRQTLLLTALASLLVLPYITLLPVLATRVFAGGPDLLGWLNAAPAVGAVTGSLFLATRRDHGLLRQRIFIAGWVTSLACLALALSPSIPWAIFSLMALGWGQVNWMASMNTRLQTEVTDAMRGRVMSFFNMSFMAALPLGQLAFGLASDLWPVSWVLGCGALLCLAGNLLLHRRPGAPATLDRAMPPRSL